MPVDSKQLHDVDLDQTDRLPILEGTTVDDDVEDDAVRLEYTASLPSIKSESSRTSAEFTRTASEFPRASAVDLPSLAESVRSVEERIARQNAEYETLKRSYEKALGGEAAAVARANAQAADLAALRAMVEAEQSRSRDLDRALADRTAAAEGTRARIEEAIRDAERHQGEANTLRDTLAARDATIVQVLHSLGERDAQLAALQKEYAHIVPALEERSQAGTQLEIDLRAARARSDALDAEVEKSRQAAAELAARLQAGEAELESARRELGAVKAQAGTYLEVLRTREWRQGFDQNLYRELDAEVGAAHQGQGALQSERDQLRRHVAELEGAVAARNASIAQLNAAASADEALRAEREHVLRNLDGARAGLLGQIEALERERAGLNDELTAKNRALEAALAAGADEVERIKMSLSAAEAAGEESAAEVRRLQAEAQSREDEMTVLMAHLQEARRPARAVEVDLARLTEELAAKTLALEALTEENRSLRLSVERTKGALEEREFLIRRLERSESANANVLGRIQTSIERLGAPAGAAGDSGSPSTIAEYRPELPAECRAELARIDGSHNTAHTLARRTRIGRAPGCELQVESTSVSRHHALVLVGQRDVIIEDLNSTNGVLVNGRRISRQLLNDGDLLTIGEAQFRLKLSLAPPEADSPAPDRH